MFTRSRKTSDAQSIQGPSWRDAEWKAANSEQPNGRFSASTSSPHGKVVGQPNTFWLKWFRSHQGTGDDATGVAEASVPGHECVWPPTSIRIARAEVYDHVVETSAEQASGDGNYVCPEVQRAELKGLETGTGDFCEIAHLLQSVVARRITTNASGSQWEWVEVSFIRGTTDPRCGVSLSRR